MKGFAVFALLTSIYYCGVGGTPATHSKRAPNDYYPVGATIDCGNGNIYKAIDILRAEASAQTCRRRYPVSTDKVSPRDYPRYTPPFLIFPLIADSFYPTTEKFNAYILLDAQGSVADSLDLNLKSCTTTVTA
ncbi:hypothetical protein K3495_g14660 [Podosphaera aphanis]|nr:hypothetical protein K3495_g14660 [Podosphaera aphanis]